MIATRYDGQKVEYIDPLGIPHRGVVVGGSEDGVWLFVQSEGYVVSDPQEWHFKVRVETAPLVIV